MQHEWGRAEVLTGFWWRNLRERDQLENLGTYGMIILRIIFRKCNVGFMDWVEPAHDRDR